MSGLSTSLTDVLGIDVPIVQAPVGSATCPSLAAAADAGALGMLAVTWRDEATTWKLLVETANRWRVRSQHRRGFEREGDSDDHSHR
ncbi:hypothetical protein [Haladaptatus caseinilyticus]|uniref:hypothetical protein n=1 Tax=Haladaptatus caseinilyticus TaxID=2993314 RepID=UPI00224B2373|nr:hypothetical protein [Haladaptatus caseinilyticus]